MKCLDSVPWKLYLSRLVSAWGDRMWMFAVGLFMMELSPGTLKWPAIYGLTRSLAVVFFAPVIGRWIDSSPRWRAAFISLTSQNAAVVACAVFVALTFHFRSFLLEAHSYGMAGACSLIITMGAIAQLASVASSIVVYQDWIAIISDRDDAKLAKLNSTCRSIDLAVNIIAPIAVGQVMYFLSHIVAAMLIAAWNVVSFFVEYLVLRDIYNENPQLAIKQNVNKPPVNNENDDALNAEGNKPLEKEPNGLAKRFRGFLKTWGVYFTHEVRNAGIALAFLYMTVLGFDSITTGYAYSQGVPESVLGVIGAVGAGVGLLGSLAFPFLIKRFGINKTGLFGFGAEVACLTMCVASVWAPGSPFDPSAIGSSFSSIDNPFTDDFKPSNESSLAINVTSSVVSEIDRTPSSYTSVILLMTGIISARFGLWVADLSVNQVLQNRVENEIRGTVNGVQSSMNMILDTMKYLLVIALPYPNTFGYLVCASFAAICVGLMFYALYVSRHQSPLKEPLTTDVVTDSQPRQEKEDLDIEGNRDDPATVRLLSETSNTSDKIAQEEEKEIEKVSVISL